MDATSSSLSSYARTGSPEALDRLVREHVDFVFAAARRQVGGDAHVAEDVTQAVFIVLARRAAAIRGDAALPGWLFNTTRHAAANARKRERRRRFHERQAAAAARPEVVMPESVTDERDERAALYPLLDAAIASLNRVDRDVVVMRYLQGRDSATVAAATGMTDAAVRKRLGRAVERLREAFAARGVTTGAAAITAALSAVTEEAPAGLAGTSLAAATGGAAFPAAAAIAKGAAWGTMLARAKVAAALLAAVTIVVGVAAIALTPGGAAPTTTGASPATAPAVVASNLPPSAAADVVPATDTLTLVVTDKQTGQPLPNTAVTESIDELQTPRTTDAAGRLVVRLPQPLPMFVGLRVARSGYSPVRLQWRSENAPDVPPATYELKMEKGTTIGGVVRDDAGQPIAGVNVHLIVDKESPDRHERSDIWDVRVRTDAQGRWRYDLAPEKMTMAWVRLSHPGYVSDGTYGATARTDSPEQYRSLDTVATMRKGLEVAGRVTDERGEPVAGATVKQGDDRWGSHHPETTTDARGEFKFAQAKAGPMTLTVEAKGFAPALKEVVVGDAASSNADFTLAKGRTITGQVVDPKGNPIAGVRVIADTWRGKRTLGWRHETRDDGRFTWDDAPPDEVQFDVIARGYMANRNAVLKADGNEHTVTLRPPMVISGSVNDAETGEPVQRFWIQSGQVRGEGQQVYWRRNKDWTFDRGSFTVTMREPFEHVMLRVEADGYAPLVSRAVTIKEGIDEPVQVDFELTAAVNTRLTVHTPDGKPAAGAKLAVATPGRSMQINGGDFDRDIARDSTVFKSNADGVILLPPSDEPKRLAVVVHDGGYALRSLDAKTADDEPIVLDAWVTVDATFRKGSSPYASKPVMAMAYPQLDGFEQRVHVSIQSQGTTDADGFCRFTKMIAGPGQVQDWSMRPNGAWGGLVQASYVATAGQTLTVQVGGTGRPVVGRLVAPAGYKGPSNWTVGGNGYLMSESTGASTTARALPYPKDWATMSFAARRAWWQGPVVAQFKEARKKELLARQTPAAVRMTQVAINVDGTFRAEDIPEGRYSLSLTLAAPWNDRADAGKVYLQRSMPVTIDPMPGGRSDEPRDLGDIIMQTPADAGIPQALATAPAYEPGSPGDVNERYYAALAAGDFDAVAQLADLSHPDAEAYVRSMTASTKAMRDAGDAVAATMSPEKAKAFYNKAGLMPPGAQARYVPRFEWAIEGDQARAVDTRFNPSLKGMTRFDGKWKYNEGEIFAIWITDPAATIARMDQYAAVWTDVARDLRAGKPVSADDVRTKLTRATAVPATTAPSR